MLTVRRVNYSATVLALLATVMAFAQNAAPPATTPQPTGANILAFDVATIKPTSRTDKAWQLLPTPDGYTGMNISLRKLIELAYGVRDGKLILGGPPWIDSAKFDIEAKFDPAQVPNVKSLTFRQRADMLQPLLADRLKLKIHHESRDFPVFLLVVDKGGLKLHESTPSDAGNLGFGIDCTFRNGAGSLTAQGCQASSLTGLLQSAAGRIILDRTGLTGHYNIELHWARDDAPVDSSVESGPSIFTALHEQLGLKLEPSTAPLDVLVIDSAEKPSEN
jgi:uncharacterized protein (TIGR03435 family)